MRNGKGFIRIVFLASVLLLGGCQMKKKFDNQEEAKKYLLSALKEKYEMDFEVIGNELYKNYGPIYGDAYSCMIAPSDDMSKEANARVTQTGTLSDDWAVYFFAEEAELKAEEICEKKEYILDYEVSLEAPATTHKWEKEDELDTYLLKSGAYDEITLYFEKGKSDEEYMDFISDFLNELYQLDINTIVKAKVGEEEILWLKVKTLGKNVTKPYTEEQIRENIEDIRIASSIARKSDRTEE